MHGRAPRREAGLAAKRLGELEALVAGSGSDARLCATAPMARDQAHSHAVSDGEYAAPRPSISKEICNAFITAAQAGRPEPGRDDLQVADGGAVAAATT